MQGLPEGIVRRRVIFHGRVQGVGFRMTTAGIAKRFPVAGFVRNVPDGTVELLAEGAPEVIDRFLAEIERAFAGHLEEVEIREAAVDAPFSGFEIRRS